MRRKFEKFGLFELIAIVLCLSLLSSCTANFFPEYSLSPKQANSKFKIVTRNGRQFAVSKGSDCIIIMTFPEELNTYKPVDSFVPFQVKVVNIGDSEVDFDPKRDIELYWSNKPSFIRDDAHELMVWDRKDVIRYEKRKAQKEELDAALSSLNVALAGISAAARPGNALLQTNAQLAAMNERLRNGIEGDPWEKFNDFRMNNDFLGTNTIPPSSQVSGQVWASQRIGTTDDFKDDNFLNPRAKGANNFLMIVRVGEDIHMIKYNVDSYKRYPRFSKLFPFIMLVVAVGGGLLLGLSTKK